MATQPVSPELQLGQRIGEVPGTGHFLMLEKPAEFNLLLKAFLERQKF